jgi:hypothetical protein
VAYLDVAVRASSRRKGEAVSGRIEGSRRHGPFDLRWPKVRAHLAAAPRTPTRMGEDIPAGLNWDDFSARYYPERGRHDFGVVSAYRAYEVDQVSGVAALPNALGKARSSSPGRQVAKNRVGVVPSLAS